MRRIDVSKKVCIACGEAVTRGVQCLACGSMLLAPAGDRLDAPHQSVQKTPRTHSLADVKPVKLVAARAPLFSCCASRAPRAASVLVTGPPGVGKSTEVAKVVIEWLAKRRSVVVLDAEMGPTLARETFVRAGASIRDLARVERVCPGQDDVESFEDAARIVDQRAPTLVVVDSVDEWGAWASGGRDAVTRAVARLGGWGESRLVIAIAHYAREGHAYGSVRAEHRADAVITVEEDAIWQKKCTWAKPASVSR